MSYHVAIDSYIEYIGSGVSGRDAIGSPSANNTRLYFEKGYASYIDSDVLISIHFMCISNGLIQKSVLAGISRL